MSELLTAVRDEMTNLLSGKAVRPIRLTGKVVNRCFTDGFYAIPVNNFKPADDKIVVLTEWKLVLSRKYVSLFVSDFSVSKDTFTPVSYFLPCNINHNPVIIDLLHLHAYKSVINDINSDIRVLDYVNLVPEFEVKEETGTGRPATTPSRKGGSRASNASRTRETNKIRKLVENEGLENFSALDMHVLSTLLK
jgi:hypothetical protein